MHLKIVHVQHHSLRPAILNRHTELFIVMTMYNEDEVLFARTWKSVVKNITYMCSKKDGGMWGPDGWKKVVVCVVSDGRTKVCNLTQMRWMENGGGLLIRTCGRFIRGP